MTNFKKAEKIIEDYRKLRLSPEKKNSFDLHKKLADVGYTNKKYVEENEKNELIKGLKFEYCDTKNTLERIMECAEKNNNIILFNKTISPSIYVGSDHFNKEYCDKNNIKQINIGYKGGTIVTNNSDLGIAVFINKELKVNVLKNKIVEWIDSNFKKCELTGNDILIDGYKVCGCASKNINGKFVFVIQVSFDVDIDLIKKICKKEIKKVPKGLNYFGDKTREDLINEIKIWLQK